MVSFIKQINEKSKELKEISKIYYDAANNLFKYIDENNKKNITNTDKKIEEINKQIATIDEKIKYAIEELLKDGTATMNERNTGFKKSLETIQKDIGKAGFSKNNNCLEEFLINKKIISDKKEIINTSRENNLQLKITKRTLGKEDLRIKFKTGGVYTGKEEKNKYIPSDGISEILIGEKKSSDFSSTDIFGICDFLNNVYTLLISKINNTNEGIESFCKNINDFISNIIEECFSSKEYSLEEKHSLEEKYSLEQYSSEKIDYYFNVKERWPNYKTLELEDNSEKQKINNYLSALFDELKSLNGDIIKTEDVKIPETNSLENNKKGENFYIDDNNVINIDFQQIFNVNDSDDYILKFENATFSGIEGVGGSPLIPNVFYKKKFGILIDGFYYSRSLEDIMNLLKDLSITFEEFKEKVKDFI